MDGRALEAARVLAHVMIGAGRYATARDLLLGVVEADPGAVDARRALVQTRLLLGEYGECEPLARALVERETGGERVCALFFHAHALWGCGREKDCRATVERYAREREALAAGVKE